MIPLCIDAILKITDFLSDRDKMQLTMISMSMDVLKYRLMYREKIHIGKIVELPYFDNFECVELSKIVNMYPKYVKYVYFKATSGNLSLLHSAPITHLSFSENFNKSIKYKIPPSVTHLRFNRYFNKEIKNDIPQSVTHLTFGHAFNQPIDNIPPSITHLILGKSFNKYSTFPQIINIIYLKLGRCYFHHELDTLPSIKYLEFDRFDFSIYKCIPQSVTHLILHRCYGPMPKNIPISITHLTFGSKFNVSIDGCIPSSIIEIKISKKYNIPISDEITLRVNIIRV